MENELPFTHCKNCRELIPKTRKKGSFYCSVKCGYDCRNAEKATKRKLIKAADPALYKNYEIIKFLVHNDRRDIAIETAEELGIDFSAHMGFIYFDKEKQTSTFRIFEFLLLICENRLKIKKITDECDRVT